MTNSTLPAQQIEQNDPTFMNQGETHETHDIIQFQTEGVQAPLVKSYAGISRMQVQVAADKTHEIVDFLSRPVVVKKGALKHSDTQGYSVAEFNFMTEYLKSVTVADKIKSFYSMRGQFCVRVVTNSTPFQTGLYYLSMAPQQMQFDTEGNYRNYSEPRPSMGILNTQLVPNITGYPGAFINIADNSSQDICLPYIGSWTTMNLKWAVNNLVRLTCLSPISGPTSNENVPFKIFAWLKDVELIGADPFNPHGAIEFQGDDSIDKILGVASGVTQMAEGKQMSDGGDVSNAAHSVKEVASTLSMIPGVADIAGPVSWLAGAVEQTGRTFGFSKPFDPQPSQPVQQNPFREYANCDGASEFTKLTVNRNAEVSIDSLGPDEDDEMTIAKLLRRPNTYYKFTWNKDQPEGTRLYQQNLIPDQFTGPSAHYESNLNPGHQIKVIPETYLSYLAGMFMYYRGSFKIKFDVVANQFYSGRLRVIYQLNNGSSDNESNPYDEPNKYAIILDLRESRTQTIVFPYIDVNHFRSTTGTYDEYWPSFEVYVDTELNRPDTVAPTVDVWMSVSCGDDFSFSGPRLAWWRQILPNTNGFTNVPVAYKNTKPFRGVLAASEPDFRRLRLEGYGEDDTSDAITQEISMCPAPPSHANVVALTQAIGDPVVSLRTLTKRLALKGRMKTKANTYGCVMPFSNEATVKAVQNATWVQHVSRLYRFKRGGMRIAISGLPLDKRIRFKLVDTSYLQTDKTVDSHFDSGLLLITENKGETSQTTFDRLPTVCELPYREDLQGALHVEIPYYTIYSMLDASAVQIGDAPTINSYQKSKNGNIALMWWSETAVDDVSVYEAAADDYNCGYLIGPPLTFNFES